MGCFHKCYAILCVAAFYDKKILFVVINDKFFSVIFRWLWTLGKGHFLAQTYNFSPGRNGAIARPVDETAFGDFTVILNATSPQMHNVQEPFPPQLDYSVKIGQETKMSV